MFEFPVVTSQYRFSLSLYIYAIVIKNEWQKMWYSTDNKWRVIKENE